MTLQIANCRLRIGIIADWAYCGLSGDSLAIRNLQSAICNLQL